MNRIPNEPGSDDLDLRRRLRALPRERSPARDLWTGIEARLAVQSPSAVAAPARPRLPWRGLALAASLAALALLAVRAGGPVAPEAVAPVASVPAAPAPAGSEALRREADALTLEFRLALEPFAQAPLPPPFQAAATELDASAAELRLALREQPQATYLLDRLRHTYERRLELTQRGALG